jgi:prepilin-type N-terminal cleavage/methylation domain-containing protein
MALKHVPRAVDRTLVPAPHRSAGQAGFTLIEVMMAALVLAAGVLGAFTLLDTANRTIATNNGRTGATNLAREVAEYARGTDYDLLTPAQAELTLRARTRIAGTGAAGAWKVVRRGITYSITPTACTFDDPKDGLAATPPPNPCTPSPAAISGAPAEINPDDFRRVGLSLAWTDRQGAHKVVQSALIVNPTGGLGPRIKTFPEPAAQILPGQITSGTQAQWISPGNPVLTDPAATVRWTADDGVSTGEVTGAAATTWSFTWNLGTLGTNPFVLDGTYLVSAQAYDISGVPGEARAVSVHVNRRIPYAPATLVAGTNLRFGKVVDLDWDPNQERDVVGYRVYRVQLLGLLRTQICTDTGLTYTVKTSCTDTSPEPLSLPVGTPNYEVAAVDYTDLRNGTSPRSGDKSSVVLASVSTAPGAPTVAVPTIVNGSPLLTWTAPAVGPGQKAIRFYRIYRDGGTSLADRYDLTVNASTTWADPAPGNTTSHKYWVTAVDISNNESNPSNMVQSP